MHVSRVFAVALSLVLLVSTVASAHTPIFLPPRSEAGVAVRGAITDPERSWAIYGQLPAGKAADVIPVVARQGQKLTLQTLVPLREELEEFRPRVVLLGPGLPGKAPADLPVELEPGEGALVLPEPAEPGTFDEPFTRTQYWTYGEEKGQYPADGTYRLVVYDPAGQGGRYTVALGDKEVWGARDLLSFPATLYRVRSWFTGR